MFTHTTISICVLVRFTQLFPFCFLIFLAFVTDNAETNFFLLSFSSSLDCQKLDFWVKDKKLKIT